MQVQRLNAYQNQNFGMINVTRPSEAITRTEFVGPLLRIAREEGVELVFPKGRGSVYSILTETGSPKQDSVSEKVRAHYSKDDIELL